MEIVTSLTFVTKVLHHLILFMLMMEYVRLHGELLLFDLLPGVIPTVRVALGMRIELGRLKGIHACSQYHCMSVW